MDAEKLANVYIPHLRGQFKQGLPVLFSGAGFSLGASSVRGELIPSYTELSRELWNLCYPGEPFEEGTSLQDLYEDARIRHCSRLSRLMAELLSVDADSLARWYETIFSMPWFRCYTLNVDNLAAAAQRKFNLPRQLSPISAVRDGAETSMAFAAGDLEVVHLNGDLNDVPDHVTFSVTQFAQRLARPDPWYLRVVADLLSHPFVFIGTRLNEPPLWQHIELRRSRGARGMRELRPRSYLVTPSLPRARQTLLAGFNVVWLPMTTEQFVKDVLEPLRPAVRPGFEALGIHRQSPKRGAAALPTVATLARHPLERTDYLIGHEPTWADIQSGRAIERKSDTEVRETISVALSKRDVKGIVVFTGTAGSGKSTALMRSCLALTAEGKRVGWVDRDTELSPRELIFAMRSDDAPDVLAIDDADLFAGELASIAHETAESENHPLVLLEIRSGKVDRVLNPAQLAGTPMEEVSMPPLADQDIGLLIDVLDRENRLGVLKGKPRSEQERVFRDQAGRQLLVAMYQATSGWKFEEKATDELFELEADAQFIYGLIATASAFRFGLQRDEVVIATGDRSNTSLNTIDQLSGRHLISVSEDGQYLRSRHRMIAGILLDALIERGQLPEVVYGLILVAATKVTQAMPRSARPCRLLRTFLNHDFLYRALDAEGARNTYGLVGPRTRGSIRAERMGLSSFQEGAARARRHGRASLG